ncbi:MAG: DUF6318 family protein [Cellulomonas sp.]|nr:DUF6318 family protein [Cellulomonas sp.]MCR6689456.1 DUF6318 family protein [Cellulomonas sp.]
MRRRLAPTAAALVCLIVLGGCTSEPSEVPPSATPSPTPAASATPSPTPAPSPTPSTAPTSGPDQDVTRPPTPPAALDGPATEDNAVLVAKYFLQLFPYIVATGDLTEWDALTGEECGYCRSGRQITREIFAAGHHGVGGAYDVGFGSASKTGQRRFVAAVDLVQYPSQTVDRDGKVVDDYPDTIAFRANIELSWTGAAWKIDGAALDRMSVG